MLNISPLFQTTYSTVSQTNQMSVTFRVFDVDCVCECFLAYEPVTDSSGDGLTRIFLDEIVDKYDSDMNNCRGQDYDNEATMVGQQKGIQSCITRKFPKAFFNPCGCNRLNLVMADVAKTSVKSVSLFGILHLFVFFNLNEEVVSNIKTFEEVNFKKGL